MNYAMNAYTKASQTGLSQRQVEAALLMKAASRLKVAQENWETDRSDFDGAVAYNRKLWTILAAAATEVDNDLPPDLKRNMALIAVFVFNRSLDMITDPKPSGLDAMIEINRNIATGLSAPPPV